MNRRGEREREREEGKRVHIFLYLERKIFRSQIHGTRNYSANVISDITVGHFTPNVKIECSIRVQFCQGKQTKTKTPPTIENKSNLFNVYVDVCICDCVCVCMCPTIKNSKKLDIFFVSSCFLRISFGF